MAKEKKTLKFQMMMSPGEAEVLDDWMFKNRVRSRAEAIRRLCQVGLAVSERMERFADVQQKLDQSIERLETVIKGTKEERGDKPYETQVIDILRAYNEFAINTRETHLELYYVNEIVKSAIDSTGVDDTLHNINYIRDVISRVTNSTPEEFERWVISLERGEES